MALGTRLRRSLNSLGVGHLPFQMRPLRFASGLGLLTVFWLSLKSRTRHSSTNGMNGAALVTRKRVRGTVRAISLSGTCDNLGDHQGPLEELFPYKPMAVSGSRNGTIKRNSPASLEGAQPTYSVWGGGRGRGGRGRGRGGCSHL